MALLLLPSQKAQREHEQVKHFICPAFLCQAIDLCESIQRQVEEMERQAQLAIQRQSILHDVRRFAGKVADQTKTCSASSLNT